MNENFEQYKQRNMPGGDKTARTASNPHEAAAMMNWLPWPRKDLAKGGKSKTPSKSHGKFQGVPKKGKKKSY
jgi:hypothetical protein